MPVIVPRKVVPLLESKPAAPEPAGLTRAEVGAMLDEQRAAFAQQIETVTAAFSAALAAAIKSAK